MTLRMPHGLVEFKNVHVERLTSMLGTDARLNSSIPKDIDFVFICYTNRSGSNLVAELFSSSGFFNLAGEFFNFDTVNEHARRHKITSVYDYFVHLCRRISKNSVLFCKLSITHLVLLHRAGVLEEIITRSRFVSVERSDRLSQAISLLIATQTGQWTSQMAPRIPSQELQFSKSQIDNIILGTIKQQSLFEAFFALNGLPYFTLVYEQFSVDPGTYIPSLCAWLGIDAPSIQASKVRIGKQSTSINVLWRDMYLGNDPRYVEAQH